MSETPDDDAPTAPAAAPWWFAALKSLIPETRIWIAGVLFLFAWHVLDLLAKSTKGELSKDTLFVSIASAIFGGGGVLAVIGFWYVASKKDAAPPPGA